MPHELPQTSPAGRDVPAQAFFGPVRGRLAAIVLLSASGAACGVVPYLAVVELARVLLPAVHGAPVDADRVRIVVVVAVLALLGGVTCVVASSFVSHFADADLQSSLRHRIVRHLQRLPLGWFDRRSSGTVRKLVEHDVVALHQLVAHSIHDVVTALTVPLVALVYLVAVQWMLGLAALAPLVVAVGLYLAMMRGGAGKYRAYDEATAALSGAAVEFVHGIAVVKRFGQLGRSHRRYREATDTYVEFVDGWNRETAVLVTLVEVVASPVTMLLWLSGVGLHLVDAGATTPVEVLAGVLLGLCLTAPLMKLASSGQLLRNAALAQESLSAFLATAPLEQPVGPEPVRGRQVDLEDVTFGYRTDRPVLCEIDARCAPGTVTALVGPSGSGKSTLASLVPRFRDPDVGRVVLGGTDVRRVQQHELYRAVGFVFQDVQLLGTSVRENIRLTRPAATDAEVEAVARAARIHGRIARLPRGYESVVGEDAAFSGGEAQRVTIARALLADAPVLVLDEATAFSDPDSEASVQRALSTLAADRTVLVIAHRLHTVTGADQILVLQEGRVVERGTHAELVAAGGAYAAMWDAYQAGHVDHSTEGAGR